MESASNPCDQLIAWLLDPDWPAVRRLAMVRMLGRSRDDPEVRALDASLAADRWVRPLLDGEWRDGRSARVPVHPYKKWGGAHWRLVALAELGVSVATPGAEPSIRAAFDATAGWLLGSSRIRRARAIEGRARICGSQDGNALWAVCRLGLADDPRVTALAKHLVRWQWPDGGWNCDVRPEAAHASFNESWAPLRGLAAYSEVTGRRAGASEARIAADRAAEFLLRHRVVESERTGRLANPAFAQVHWPPYWHYDLLAGLRALSEAGRSADPRAADALEMVARMRGADGRWRPHGRWWRSPGASGANVEIVDWGREGEARMVTLHALEVLGHLERRGAVAGSP